MMIYPAPATQASCLTCFFGVRDLCCLRLEEKVCPTYRPSDAADVRALPSPLILRAATSPFKRP